MHRMLQRQLRRHFGDAVPEDPRWRAFLDDVDAAYREADGGRALLERALELTSEELFARNQELQEAMSGADIATWALSASGDHIALQGFPTPFVRDNLTRRSMPLTAFLETVAAEDRDRVASTLRDPELPDRLVVRFWIEDERGPRYLEMRGRRASTAAAGHVGICIDVTREQRADDEHLRIAQHHAVLMGLAQSMAGAWGNLEAVFDLITAEVAATLGVAGVAIWLYEPTQGTLSVASACFDGAHERGQVLDLSAHPRYKAAIATHRVIAAEDATTHPATRSLASACLTPRGLTAVLDASILMRDEVLGVVCHAHRGPPRVWTPDEQAFAVSIADLVALAIEGHRRSTVEAALAAQERLLRTVIDTAPNLIFAKDRAGRFTLANQATADLYGCAIADLIGKTDADFNPSSDEVEHFRHDDLAVMDTLSERIIEEEQVTDATHRARWFQTVKRPLIGGDGRADHVLGVATEITERKHAERERARLEDKLRQAQQLESLGLLAGGVAHDFNNLLTPILVCADLLQELPPGDPSTHEYLEDIRAAGVRARDLTAQLLAFGRKQPLVMAAVDLNAEIEQTRAMLSRVVPAHIEIAVDLQPGLPPIRADRTQVHQILMNLGANARDAMPLGGRLGFATRLEHRDDGVLVALTVSDTGHGMDAQTAAQVFEPFFTTKERGRGTGLGLATVYGVVHQHGGSIEVESSPGHGTTFVIRLPAATSGRHATLAATAQPRIEPRATRATVLLVEDDPRVLRLVGTLLKRRPIDLLSTPSPERALELARDHPGAIDLLITDMIMPGMTGIQLHQRLLADRAVLPVLLMTGYAETPLLLAVDSVLLRKPFAAADLLQHVDDLLGANQPNTRRVRRLTGT